MQHRFLKHQVKIVMQTPFGWVEVEECQGQSPNSPLLSHILSHEKCVCLNVSLSVSVSLSVYLFSAFPRSFFYLSSLFTLLPSPSFSRTLSSHHLLLFFFYLLFALALLLYVLAHFFYFSLFLKANKYSFFLYVSFDFLPLFESMGEGRKEPFCRE